MVVARRHQPSCSPGNSTISSQILPLLRNLDFRSGIHHPTTSPSARDTVLRISTTREALTSAGSNWLVEQLYEASKIISWPITP
jgi:hypothetical protein